MRLPFRHLTILKKINLPIVTYIRLSYIPIYHSGQIRIYFHSLLPTSFSAPRLIFVAGEGLEPPTFGL